MAQTPALVSLLVCDHDEALAFCVGTLGFVVVEDDPVPEQGKRRVAVSPPGPATAGCCRRGPRRRSR
jgi:hypothetical protein